MSDLKQRRNRTFHPSDLLAHTSEADCWVAHGRAVYDLSAFVSHHPGGPELIVDLAGTDVASAMESEHVSHSPAAYAMLAPYRIGTLSDPATTTLVDPKWSIAPDATDDFHPPASDAQADLATHAFLDLDRPLFLQVLRSDWSKAFYLHQVHQPRHLPHSAILLGPPVLEALTKTPWYVVPLLWGPIAAFLLARAWQALVAADTPFQSALLITASAYVFGAVLWTLLEYAFHRFLFHLDDYLPDHPAAFALHFLLHGVHHYLPMDPLRLVMPPTLFAALSYPMTHLAYALFPTPFANATIAGAFTLYIVYDTMHYAMHHTNLPSYLRTQKAYHLAHHYRNFELGFGVTSKFWDKIFGTELLTVKST